MMTRSQQDHEGTNHRRGWRPVGLRWVRRILTGGRIDAAGFSLIERRGIFPTVPVLTRWIRRRPAQLAWLHRLLTRALPVPGWCFLNVLRFTRP